MNYCETNKLAPALILAGRLPTRTYCTLIESFDPLLQYCSVAVYPVAVYRCWLIRSELCP